MFFAAQMYSPAVSKAGHSARACLRQFSLIRISKSPTNSFLYSTKAQLLQSEIAPANTTPSPNASTPLAVLPTKTLLRSLLISTISTKYFLLTPALGVLGFLTRSKSRFFNPDKNPLLHFVLKKSFYEHFCAGENEKEVRRTVKNIKDMGFKGVILTYAREVVVDRTVGGEKEAAGSDGEVMVTDKDLADIDSWKKGVLHTVEMIGEDDYLALKFTGAGGSAIDALKKGRPVPDQIKNALYKICERALERKVRILVDAEQQSEQNGIDALALELMRKYNRSGTATVYNTYQAYLKSTATTLESHMNIASAEGFTIGVKLVRGAYINSEPRQLIHDTKENTDHMYDSIAENLLTRNASQIKGNRSGKEVFPETELFLGTHNGHSAKLAHKIHSSRVASGLPTIRVQYGQLLGMADDVSGELVQMASKKHPELGPDVYKCLSWGSVGECVSYLMRRAVENRDAVSRTQDAHFAILKEIRRRLRLKTPGL